jgi:light-regulated signal transduction histidine kinase (bacteriophytochrome)
LIVGKIPWAAYFHNWWTWWMGDTIGVLIVTPLLLSWLAEPRDIWRRRRLTVSVPLVGTFALAVVVAVQTSSHELIAHAVAGVTHMHTLIQDLLAYSWVGARSESLQPTNCAAVLDDVLANLEVSIRESKAVVTAAPLPTVMANPAQLRQVFQNLIGNALKFRGEEPPRIRIGVKHEGGEWVFAVCDNGIGIHPQYFERIFQVLQRLHTQRKYEGSGIGLAICKKIIERHGGRIWVTSKPSKGSTFSFTIGDQR